MFGVSHFKNKVVVIAGAEHPLAASLCRRMAGFGALVVAIGQSPDTLIALARHDPRRIETLALGSGRGDMLELLRASWGEEPLNYYADFWPLNPDPAADGFARSAGLAVALMGGVRAGQALSVMAVPGAGAGPEPKLKGVDTIVGYEALLKRLADRARPGRFVGMRLPVALGEMSEEDCVSAGDIVLTLFHPVSRGLKNGSIVDWVPQQA